MHFNVTTGGSGLPSGDGESLPYDFRYRATSNIVGISVTVTIGIWEYCSFFPAEIVLWKRLARGGRTGRSSFAPWTTLTLRYLLLCFSVVAAFMFWSTTMDTRAACEVGSVFFIASGDLLNAVVAFAIAWRAQAVARGVIQRRRCIRWMQFAISLLVLAQFFEIIFSTLWPTVRNVFWRPYLDGGICLAEDADADFVPDRFDGRSYATDPLLWHYVFTIIYNAACLGVVLTALHSLSIRSRGFSKLIAGMRNHSLFFFILVLLLSLMAIMWRGLTGITWIYGPTTTLEAAVMIRILMAEQDAARRPLDTTFIDNGYPAGPSHYPTQPTQQRSHQHTGPRDATIRSAHHEYSSQDGQQSQLPGVTQQQIMPNTGTPRRIYQPFSVMDNLGQAFSQVDSRGPGDIEDQSLDSNHQNRFLAVTPGDYPGVMHEEMLKERILQQSSGEMRASDDSAEKAGESESIAGNGNKTTLERVVNPLQRTVSLHSVRDRIYPLSRPSADPNRDEIDSDDEEVGIQTVPY